MIFGEFYYFSRVKRNYMKTWNLLKIILEIVKKNAEKFVTRRCIILKSLNEMKLANIYSNLSNFVCVSLI